MDMVNPYEPSGTISSAPHEATAPAISLLRGFLIVLCAGAAGALLGLILGGLMGTFVPDYYHAVFGNPELNAVQVGTGLGLTQGFGVGVAVGCVVLLAVAISHRRKCSPSVQS